MARGDNGDVRGQVTGTRGIAIGPGGIGVIGRSPPVGQNPVDLGAIDLPVRLPVIGAMAVAVAATTPRGVAIHPRGVDVIGRGPPVGQDAAGLGAVDLPACIAVVSAVIGNLLDGQWVGFRRQGDRIDQGAVLIFDGGADGLFALGLHGHRNLVAEVDGHGRQGAGE